MKSIGKPNLLDRLRIDIPLILAPMAGIGTPALAAAVSNAGGLGSLAIGAMNVESARTSIRELRALTEKPFNVNLFAHRPAKPDPVREANWLDFLKPYFAEFDVEPPQALAEIYPSFVDDDAMLEMLLQEQPPVVSFHFGLPSKERIAALHGAGIFLLANATTLDEIHQIEQAGIDAVIVQGIEAGGHRGSFNPDTDDDEFSTLALVSRAMSETRLPVIAAGGIMDGFGIAAVLVLGSQAAVLGTAFISAPESAASAAFREALVGPDTRTVFTSAISGRRARAIQNGFTELGNDPGRPPIPDYPIAYDAGKRLHAAASAAGSTRYAAHWAGQGVGLSRAMPAAELVETLAHEMREAISILQWT
jgi:nitronate monooxygenase